MNDEKTTRRRFLVATIAGYSAIASGLGLIAYRRAGWIIALVFALVLGLATQLPRIRIDSRSPPGSILSPSFTNVWPARTRLPFSFLQ